MPDYLEIPSANNIQGGVDRSDGFVTPFQLQPAAPTGKLVKCRYTFFLAGASVQMLVESVNPPGVVVDQADNSVLLGLVSIGTQGTVEFDVQPGSWVQFVKVGGGTATYVTGAETIYKN